MFGKKKETESKSTHTKNESERHASQNDGRTSSALPDSEHEKQPDDQDDHVYPTGIKLALILASIYIGMFLVALVRYDIP